MNELQQHQSLDMEEIAEAVKYSSGLTPRVKNILITLVCCSKNYVIEMQVDVLADTVSNTLGKVTRQYCYPAFKTLERKGFLFRSKRLKARGTTFTISKQKIEEIVASYRSLKVGQSILRNIKKDQHNT